MITHNIPFLMEDQNSIFIMPPDLVLKLTLSSWNYPYLKQFSMVTNLFEPLKFGCISIKSRCSPTNNCSQKYMIEITLRAFSPQ